jgi:hypothetical protein
LLFILFLFSHTKIKNFVYKILIIWVFFIHLNLLCLAICAVGIEAGGSVICAAAKLCADTATNYLLCLAICAVGIEAGGSVICAAAKLCADTATNYLLCLAICAVGIEAGGRVICAAAKLCADTATKQ